MATRLESGERFGRLTVMEDRGYKDVLCLCECGTSMTFRRCNLVRGASKSCGCLRRQQLQEKWKKHSKTVSIPQGTVFHRLTVLRNERQWVLCRYSCGAERWIWRYDLLAEKTKSCGCLNKEVAAERLRKTATIHGGWGRPEWNSWHAMKKRCLDPQAMGYENYGGRGIGIHEPWITSFANFLRDMGPSPSPHHTLDRLDIDGDYGPGNVRWATRKEQARNRRNNREIRAFGKIQCLAAWAEETGLSSTTIRYRLLKGWPPERALRKKKGV